MAHRNFSPKSVYQNQVEIDRAQPVSADDKTPFSQGAFQDLDGYLVPAKGVHKLFNYRCHFGALKARGGTRRWSNTTLPALPNRTGYSLTKSGTTVTKSVGQNFSSADIGNYIVYDDGLHERISAFIDVDNVTVETSTVHSASTAAWMRGPVNCKPLWHEKKSAWVLFIDTRLFYNDLYMTSPWSEIVKSGIFLPPTATVSRLREFDDYAQLANANGLFKIDLDNYVYWKSNSGIPTTRITDQGKTAYTPYCRRVLCSMARLTGNGQNDNRYSSGVTLQQESGTTYPDSSNKDYGEIWTQRPIGPADTTYGVLTGAALTAPYDDVAGWQGFTVVQFGISINGTTHNVIGDVTGVLSLEDVASRIQTGLRDYWSTATCELVVSGSYKWFKITSPDEGGSVSVVTAGGGATDIGTSIMACESGNGVVTTPYYTDVKTIWFLEIPLDPTTGYHDAHWNRYVLHATLDVGPNGRDPVSGAGNSSEQYMWNADIPVAKAFVASATGGTVTATVGEFVPGDVNSKLRFANGTEVTLQTYVSATQMTCSYYTSVTSQAAAIGGDNAEGKPIRVMTASQTGTTVTRTAGDTFSSTDVGRRIYWANGYESTVVEYTDANTVEVHESRTIASTGACIHPKCRKWTDTVRDEPYLTTPNLRSRIAKYSLQNRFFIPLPNSNEMEITANMLWVVTRGEKVIYYSPADTNYRHQAGYHYFEEQREFVPDAITEISQVNDYLSIKCVKMTRAIDLNTLGASYTIPGTGTAIIKCPRNFPAGDNIGVRYYGGVCKINNDEEMVITSEPGIRKYNGREYGPNRAVNRILKDLKKLQVGYACCYDDENGFTFWGLDE